MTLLKVSIEFELVEQMLNQVGGGSTTLVREIASLMESILETTLLNDEQIPSLTYVFRKAWIEIMGVTR